ncbi:MAG: DUF2157 domain-containing protein [Pseudomonas sp.]
MQKIGKRHQQPPLDWLAELRSRDQLLSWTEQGLLTPAQLARALAPEHPAPTDRHWRAALDRLLAYYGSLLLVLGVIFFFAFNWDELHRLHKLALALVALTGFAGAAVVLQSGSALYRASLFGAALTTGGVLALVGQIYQTGADIWQLFAGWAALMLPWALISRSAACWALFWVVLHVALLRYFALHPGGPTSAQGLTALAVADLALLLVFEGAGHRLCTELSRVLPRLAGFGLLSALTLGGCISWWQEGYLALLIALALVYLVGITVYLRWRRDALMLALLLYSLIGVTASGLGRLLDTGVNADSFMLLNVLGLFVLLTSAAASLWLHRLHRGAQHE